MTMEISIGDEERLSRTFMEELFDATGVGSEYNVGVDVRCTLLSPEFTEIEDNCCKEDCRTLTVEVENGIKIWLGKVERARDEGIN